MRCSHRCPEPRANPTEAIHHEESDDVPVVQRPGRGGRALLRVALQGRGDRKHDTRHRRQGHVCFNGGPHYKLNPAVSLFIDCVDQAEVDTLWDKLIADGGMPNQCGWLTDRYGLCWQVIPRKLMEVLSSPDRERADRSMQAMLQMRKIDVAALEKAFAGG